MGAIYRGMKNAFRNGIRTFSIIFILAVSIAMALIMFTSLKTVQSKIDSVKSSIGNYITVSPAGIRGFEGGGELLTDSDIANLSSITHVTKIVQTVSDRLSNGQDTNLQSAIEPGSFGSRQRTRDINTNSNNANNPGRAFTMPIMITGTNDLSITANLNVSKFDITSGDKFDEASQDNLAMIGTALATKNNLNVGSVFQAYGKDIKVVGIFDGGNTFANASVIMPIKTLQNLSGQTGQASQVIVQADSIDSISSVENDLKAKLGSKVDVVSQQDSSQEAIKPLENIKTISLYSLIGALIAGAIIIFLTMVMIVRERRREIGVLKAIGGSNAIIMAQFTIESLVLTLISSIIGIIIGLALSNPVLKVLISNSQSVGNTADTTNGAARMLTRIGANFGPNARSILTDLHTVIGYDIILYGLIAAIIIAIIGSALPAFIIAKVKPAEILRSE